MENIEKIIKERHSVREYLDKEIEKEKVNELNKLIKSINEKEDLNIQLILDDQDVFDKTLNFLDEKWLQELRIRASKPVTVCYNAEFYYLGNNGIVNNREKSIKH